MKINQDTFCGATWFQTRNRQDMTKSICCLTEAYSDDPGTESMTPMEYLNSPKIVQMREQMADGIRVPQCHLCWKDEDSGTQSYRQKINSYLHSPWFTSYFKHKKDFNTDMVVMADVKIGNTCNFACVMCNPSDSSMIYNSWAKQKDSPFVKDYIDADPDYFERVKRTGYKSTSYRNYIESILSNDKIRYIKFLGGEPLLDHKLLQMLVDLPDSRKKKLSLNFVTNGSHDLVEHSKRLGNFHRIQWAVSLEGIGATQDYARYGSEWNQIEKHILAQKEFADNVSVITCIQATTITKLHELVQWTKTHNIPFALGTVENPAYLTMSSVPDKLKKIALEKLKNVGSYIVYEEKEFTPFDIDSLIDLIDNTKYNKRLHKKFIEFVPFYEKGKILPNFLDVFEEWRPYFEV